MKKQLKNDLKRIIALLLVAIMIIPMNTVVRAEDTIQLQADTSSEIDPSVNDEAYSEEYSNNESSYEFSLNDASDEEPLSITLVNDVSSDEELAGNNLLVEDYSDEERSNVTLSGNSSIDEEAEDLLSADDESKTYSIEEYLKLKYSDENEYTLTENGSGYITNISKNGEEVKVIDIDGSDNDGYADKLNKGRPYSFEQLQPLTFLQNAEELSISNISDLEYIYFPGSNCLKKLNIQNTTLDLFNGCYSFSGTSNGELGKCALTDLTLDITMGDNYSPSSPKHQTYYSSELSVNLSGSGDTLAHLNIKVKFTNTDQVFTIKAGDKAFAKLTAENCTIEIDPAGAKGSIVVENADNCQVLKDAVSSSSLTKITTPQILNSIKSQYPSLDKTYFTSSDISQITSLTINKNTSGDLITLSDLSELSKLTSLQELYVVGDGGNPVIKKIDFPESITILQMSDLAIADEALENENGIKNTSTNREGNILKLPATENIYFKNIIDQDSEGHPAKFDLVIADTNGIVKTAKFDGTQMGSISLNNGGPKGVVEISANNCSYVHDVLFTGNGYKITGNTSFQDCAALEHIGTQSSTDNNKWTIEGTFGSSSEATLNILNCASLGRKEYESNNEQYSSLPIGEIKLDYDFSSEKTLNLIAYGTNSIGGTTPSSDSSTYQVPSKLVFKEYAAHENGNVLNGGRVNISCSTGSWIEDIYGAERQSAKGYILADTSSDSTPDIAVFPLGNQLISEYEAEHPGAVYEIDDDDDEWVYRWDVEVQDGYEGYNTDSVNRDNKLKFYVKVGSGDKQTLRNINYDIEDVDIVVKDNNGNPVTSFKGGSTSVFDNSGSPQFANIGRYKIEVHLKDAESTLIGYQWYHVYQRSQSIALSVSRNGVNVPLGSVDKPTNVEYGDFTFRATKTPNSDVMPNVFWQIHKDDCNVDYYEVNGRVNCISYSSNAGISVVDNKGDSYWYKPEGESNYVNERTYSFPQSLVNGNNKLKIVAIDAYTKTPENKKVAFLQIKDPCEIRINNDSQAIDNKETLSPTTTKATIVQGRTGEDSATITVSNIGDTEAVQLSALEDTYGDLLKFTRESTSTTNNNTSVYKVKFNSKDESNPTGKTDREIAEAIRAINASDNKFITVSNQVDYTVHKVRFALDSDFYYIDYDYSNGNAVEDNPDAYNKNSSLVTIKDPGRTGYTFKNWTCTEKGNDSKVISVTHDATGKTSTFPASTAKDVKLKANWEVNNYTIAFNGNGNSGGTMASINAVYGTASSLTENAFIRTGYNFTGWNSKADGTGTSYADKASVINLTTENNVSVTLYAQWELKKPKVKSASLSLSDATIGINFYMENIANYANGKTYISVGGEEHLIDGPTAEGEYVYTGHVNAKEMNDKLEVIVYERTSSTGKTIIPLDNDSVVQNETDSQYGIFKYSVNDYLSGATSKENEGSKLYNLATAMKNYGLCSQYYFGYEAPASMPEISSSITDYANYKAEISTTLPDGVTYVGSSLLLKSSTTVRHYFRINDISKVTFTLNGSTVDKTKDIIYKDGLYYIDVNDIKPVDLGTKHTLSISDGSKTFTIKYCALSYCEKVYNMQSNETLKTLANSMYWYHKAANDYFKIN